MASPRHLDYFRTALLMSAVVLTIAVYLPGLSGDYMFDDMPNILENRWLEIETPDFDSLYTAAMSSGSGPLRRPVSMLSFTLNRYFFGLNPYSYKVTNLVIHLLTGLALFVLGRMLICAWRQRHQPELAESVTTWLPLAVTALWLVHPLNLSSVLYIVQRMTSLAALFTVCGLCFYVAGRTRMLAGKHGILHILTGLLACGSLAVFSKETGALLPAFMFVIELALFRFRNADGRTDKFTTGFFIVVLLIPACLFLGYVATNPEWITRSFEMRMFTLTERVLTEARVLVFYLKLIVMPTTVELGMYHDDIALSHGLLSPPSTLLSILALLGLFAGAILLLGKQPLISLGILWFFTGHALESTIFSLELVHEHRNYLADYGIILALAGALMALPMKDHGRLIRTAAPVFFLGIFATTTLLRAQQWSDNINVAVYEARHHPESFRSVYAAGRIHARLAINDHPGSGDKAFDYLDQAGAINKADIMPDVVKIKLSYLLDRPVRQEWIDEVDRRLALYPIIPSTLDSLYELASCMNDKCTLPHEDMEEMFRLTLENPSLEFNIGLHAEAVTIYGYFTINIRGNFEKGRELFFQAVELDPRETQRWINLINLLTVMNDLDTAEQQLARFREADTHGGNDKNFRDLMDAIEKKRAAQASTETVVNPGES